MGKNDKNNNAKKPAAPQGNYGDPATLLDEATKAMQNALDSMNRDFAAVRTGKASPSMVENIKVPYYGTPTPLKNMAAVTAPEPLLLVIRPYDQNSIKDITKAIQASELGITPVTDGRTVRLPVPELSAERRSELSKVVKKRAEDAKVEIRNVRRDCNDAIKAAQKASTITEDESKQKTEQVQKLTDKMIDAATAACDAKITEIDSI